MSTVDHLVELLDLFVTEPQLGVREMGRRLAISKSSAQRLASRMAQADLLARDEDTGRYRLGLRFIELGVLVQARNELLGVAAPVLRSLARFSGESVHLGVLHDLEIFYIGRIEGEQSLSPATRMVRRGQTYTTSLGKAVLAFQDEAVIDRVIAGGLHQLTPHTIAEPQELRSHLRRIREQGYALNLEELVLGLRCVAAPIRSASGAVIAGLSLTGTVQRMTREKMMSLVGPVVDGANQISQGLGWQPTAVRPTGGTSLESAPPARPAPRLRQR